MTRILIHCSFGLALGSVILLLSSPIVNHSPIVLFLSKAGLVLGGTTIPLISLLRRFVGESRTDALLKNLIILGTAVLASSIIAEGSVRFIFRHITTTSNNNSYFAYRWNKSNVRLNRWGFREREFELPKKDDIYRIAVIGDSFTYGQGIPEEDRFTNLLEKYLNRKKSTYQVLNFGRPGTETIDHLATLKDVVAKANINFILLQWFTNDFEGHDKKARPRGESPIKSFALYKILDRSSALFYLIKRQVKSLQSTLGFVGSYDKYMFQRFGNPESPDSQKYVKIMKDFIKLCKNREIPLGIVLFPNSRPDLREHYPFDYLHDRVLEICAEEDIDCIDLRSTFADVYYKDLWVNRFDPHPGTLANRLATERIFNAFGEMWLSERFGK